VSIHTRDEAAPADQLRDAATLYTFTIETQADDGSWLRVATWQRFDDDEAAALAGTIAAARREWPADRLRVRPEDVA
jgi:hypothetical protein